MFSAKLTDKTLITKRENAIKRILNALQNSEDKLIKCYVVEGINSKFVNAEKANAALQIMGDHFESLLRKAYFLSEGEPTPHITSSDVKQFQIK